MKSLSLLFAAVGLSISTLAQSPKPDTLYIESVNFRSETAASIDCVNFEHNFENRIQFAVLTNRDSLDILETFLGRIKYSHKVEDIDVRAKFLYKKRNGTTLRICMSKFEIMVDGQLIKYDNRFYSFLKGLTAP